MQAWLVACQDGTHQYSIHWSAYWCGPWAVRYRALVMQGCTHIDKVCLGLALWCCHCCSLQGLTVGLGVTHAWGFVPWGSHLGFFRLWVLDTLFVNKIWRTIEPWLTLGPASLPLWVGSLSPPTPQVPLFHPSSSFTFLVPVSYPVWGHWPCCIGGGSLGTIIALCYQQGPGYRHGKCQSWACVWQCLGMGHGHHTPNHKEHLGGNLRPSNNIHISSTRWCRVCYFGGHLSVVDGLLGWWEGGVDTSALAPGSAISFYIVFCKWCNQVWD